MTPRKWARVLRNSLVIAGAVLVVAMIVVVATGSPTDSKDPGPAAAKASASPWFPAGFRLISVDPPVAGRYLDASEFACDLPDTRCKGMLVVAKDGCASSLYVALSVSNASGTAVGFTNDLMGGVAPLQQAKLVFTVLEPDAATVSVSEVVCY